MKDNYNAPYVKTEIPGPRSREILGKQKELETRTVTYPEGFPIAIKGAKGSVIEDLDGNRFIDWVSGICVLNLGYSDEIREAVKNQMDLIWHSLEMPTEARIGFMESLRKSFPLSMRNYRTVFGISGADACETAVNIAHSVSAKNTSTIVFEGAYHGVSGGIASATAGVKYRRTQYSRGFEVVRVPYPYKMWYKSDTGDIIDMIRRIMTDPEAGYNTPDSVLVEPILGEGGYVIPPEGFLKSIREACDEYGLTMIVDEVQTGLGRTGKMWAFEWEGITPDIVCISKSIGGGVPVSAVYYREEYDLKLAKPFHLGTYRANPLALAAGTYVLNEVPRHLDRVVREGKEMLAKLREIESPYIGEVRGKGFMLAVELTKEGMPMPVDRMMDIKHDLLRNGLMMHTCGHFSNVFRYMGALNIDAELNRRGLEIFRNVIEKLQI